MAQDQSTDKSLQSKCKHCGVWHGGVFDKDVCSDCWSKGKR